MADYSAYNDFELSVLLREGDSIAFQEIYKRYCELLYLFAYRKLKNEADARDVVHDVFAWLLENGQRLSLKTSISSYLYKSVLNKVFDIFRKQNTFQRYLEKREHFINVDNKGTDYLIREKEIIKLIEHEIAAMPLRMREVYELKYRENLSYNQISEKLNISPQTAKTHIKHATKRLKSKLGLIIFLLCAQSTSYILFS